MARIVVPPWEVSQRFRDAVRQGHDVTTLVEVFPGVLAQSGAPLAELETVTAGSATIDASATIRARCDLTLGLDGQFSRAELEELLAPLGNEIRLCRGIRYSDGDEEFVSLGRLRVEEHDSSTSDETIKFTAYDRAKIIEDDTFPADGSIADGTQATDAILDLVRATIPNLSYRFIETDAPLPLLDYGEGDNRWAMAQGIATSIGGELYFDALAELVLQPIPSTTSQSPRYELTDGEDGVLISADKRRTREGTANRIVVVGTNPNNDGAPPRAEAIDNDPNSPTYFYGPFGKVTYRADEYASFISSNVQAQGLANGLLAKKRGLTRQVSFGAVVNPSLTPADVARLRSEKLDTDELAAIESLTIALGAEEAMSGQTRAVQEV
jgi:hypothetical protein